MSEWQPIETAPKDGRNVWVKRVYNGEIIKEGWAVWGKHPDPEFPEDRWMNADMEFSFPTPTHWLPTITL